MDTRSAGMLAETPITMGIAAKGNIGFWTIEVAQRNDI